MGVRVEKALIEIGADASQLLTALNDSSKAAEAADAVLKTVGADTTKLEAAAQQLKGTNVLVEALAKRLGITKGEARKLARELNDVEAAVEEVSQASADSGGFGLLELDAAINLATQAATAILEMAQATADLGNELTDTSVKSGVARDTLAGLRLAAEASKQDFNSLAEGLQALPRKLAEIQTAGSPAAEALARLGIAGDSLSGTDDLLRKLAGRLAEGGANAADLDRILGESFGPRFRQALAGSSDGLDQFIAAADRLGTTRGAEAAQELQVSFAAAGEAIAGAQLKILEAVSEAAGGTEQATAVMVGGIVAVGDATVAVVEITGTAAQTIGGNWNRIAQAVNVSAETTSTIWRTAVGTAVEVTLLGVGQVGSALEGVATTIGVVWGGVLDLVRWAIQDLQGDLAALSEFAGKVGLDALSEDLGAGAAALARLDDTAGEFQDKLVAITESAADTGRVLQELPASISDAVTAIEVQPLELDLDFQVPDQAFSGLSTEAEKELDKIQKAIDSLSGSTGDRLFSLQAEVDGADAIERGLVVSLREIEELRASATADQVVQLEQVREMVQLEAALKGRLEDQAVIRNAQQVIQDASLTSEQKKLQVLDEQIASLRIISESAGPEAAAALEAVAGLEAAKLRLEIEFDAEQAKEELEQLSDYLKSVEDVMAASGRAIGATLGILSDAFAAAAESSGTSSRKLARIGRALALVEIAVNTAIAAVTAFKAGVEAASSNPFTAPFAAAIGASYAAPVVAGAIASAIPILNSAPSLARGVADFRSMPSVASRSRDSVDATLHQGETVLSQQGTREIEKALRGNGPTGGATRLQMVWRGEVLDEALYDAVRRPGSPLADELHRQETLSSEAS